MTEPRHVLVIDDDSGILSVVRALLEAAGYRVTTAGNGADGIALARSDRPDAVLLDVAMPRMSGLEVCAAIRSLPETVDIPVAMLSVKAEIPDLIAGMQVGADDYVAKPFSRGRLLDVVARLSAGPAGDSGRLVPHAPGDARARALLIDPVTGLPTLAVVVDALRDRLRSDERLGVILLEIDPEGRVESWHGWQVFDEVMKEAARTLKRLLGTKLSTRDLLAVGGPSGSDLFVFGNPPGSGSSSGPEADLRTRALSLEELLSERLAETFEGRTHAPVAVHSGWSTARFTPLSRPERTVERAVRDAATLASSREEEISRRRREAFRDVLAERRIETVFQPVVDLSTGEVYAQEALSRGPVELGFGAPEALFEYAARTGQLFELETVCIAFSASRFATLGGGILFVNVEPEVLAELDGRGRQVLQPLEPLASRVILEITERGAVTDWEGFRAVLGELKGMGFRIAVDDAGSGWASLQSIAELRPDVLKITGYLVAGLAKDSIKRDIVEMLVHLASRLGASTVAEGIESEDDLAELKRLGVTHGQGFLLGHPLAAPSP